ncbi:SDR family oxidoreductase [Adlercreutzia sp. R7]|uniref:SDR family oxidoreductase n=1 Tax=Adlercreutzia wanghongyangiae TaxID=3111451 RepID=A0ABU6IK87_9ACTN|nr:SDR family oxidoreductase [Adlercreutzia sp. R7]
MGNRLENKVAIVAASTRGIGRATAELFAKEGAKVVVSGRNEELGVKLVESIKADGGEAMFVRTDVTVPEDMENLVAKTVEQYGTIDILVNNAGGGNSQNFVDYTVKDWNDINDLNGLSVFLGVKNVLPIMMKNGSGSIVNVTSTCVHKATWGSTIYAYAKAGVIAMTKFLATEFAEYGIRVNCVSPGVVNTDIHKEYSAEILNAMIEDIPMKRMGEPIELAYPILFMASDEASYCSGRVLDANGAWAL